MQHLQQTPSRRPVSSRASAIMMAALSMLLSSCSDPIHNDGVNPVVGPAHEVDRSPGERGQSTATKKSSEEDDRNACELDNGDVTWVLSGVLGVVFNLSSRAVSYVEDTSEEVRNCLLGGLDDPERFAICHVLLLQIYDKNETFYESLQDQLSEEDFDARGFGQGLIVKIGPGPVAPVFSTPEVLINAWDKHLREWDREHAVAQ